MFERKRMNGGSEGVVGWRDGEGGCDVAVFEDVVN